MLATIVYLCNVNAENRTHPECQDDQICGVPLLIDVQRDETCKKVIER